MANSFVLILTTALSEVFAMYPLKEALGVRNIQAYKILNLGGAIICLFCSIIPNSFSLYFFHLCLMLCMYCLLIAAQYFPNHILNIATQKLRQFQPSQTLRVCDSICSAVFCFGTVCHDTFVARTATPRSHEHVISRFTISRYAIFTILGAAPKKSRNPFPVIQIT